MMNKDTLIAICAGSLSAVAAFPLLKETSGGFIFAFFAPLPLLLVGFSFGAVTGTISAIAGVVTAALMGGMMVSSLFAVLHAFPAWVIARQSLLRYKTQGGNDQWYPVGSIISLLALMAAFMLAMVATAEWQNIDAVLKNLGNEFDRAIRHMLPTLPDPQRAGLVNLFISIYPAFIATSWIFMAIINAVIAQSILIKFDKNIRPRPVYSTLSLPEWHSWAVVVSASLALIGSGKIEFVAHNIVIIMMVPFFFLGLAVAHQLARRVTFPGLLLAAVYISIFFSLWAVLVIAVIGVIEQWFGLRHRLPAQGPTRGPNQEDE